MHLRAFSCIARRLAWPPVRAALGPGGDRSDAPCVPPLVRLCAFAFACAQRQIANRQKQPGNEAKKSAFCRDCRNSFCAFCERARARATAMPRERICAGHILSRLEGTACRPRAHRVILRPAATDYLGERSSRFPLCPPQRLHYPISSAATYATRGTSTPLRCCRSSIERSIVTRPRRCVPNSDTLRCTPRKAFSNSARCAAKRAPKLKEGTPSLFSSQGDIEGSSGRSPFLGGNGGLKRSILRPPFRPPSRMNRCSAKPVRPSDAVNPRKVSVVRQ